MRHLVLLIGILLLFNHLPAQCPIEINATLTLEHETCLSNGAVHIASNIPAGLGHYMLTDGPSQAPLNLPQTNPDFLSLPSGTYTVNVRCGDHSKDYTFTIEDQYIEITNVIASTETSCGNGTFQPGGTITVGSVEGGKGNLQYSIIYSTDPNYNDNLSDYSAVSTFNVNEYGTYQLRVKDDCGEFFTKTVQLIQDFPPVRLGWFGAQPDDCPHDSVRVDGFDLLNYNNNTPVNSYTYFQAGGLKINIWEQAPGSGCAKGETLLFSGIITSSEFSFKYSDSQKYYVQCINPCGDTTAICYDANETGKFDPYIDVYQTSIGCGTNEELKIVTSFYMMKYPITLEIKNSSGTTVHTSTLSSGVSTITGLPLGYYTVTATDKCGNVQTNEVYENLGTPDIQLWWTDMWRCVADEGITEEGTTGVNVYIDGDIPDLDNASVQIINGPNNVGVYGLRLEDNNPRLYQWQNMRAGTYQIQIISDCYNNTLPLTIGSNESFLEQHITATGESYCAGNGTISSEAFYNGSFGVTYVLYSVGTSMSIDSNATGIFENLPTGDYLVRMKINNYCSDSYYYINSNTVTITGGNEDPQIVKKLGITCEDSEGEPTTTGTAYFNLSGGEPLLLQYKLNTSSTWTVISEDANTTEEISGLTAGNTYDIQLKSCGRTTSTQVTIGTLSRISLETVYNPCYDKPYTLKAPEMPGAAYEWKNPQGTIVSSTAAYDIPNYTAAYDGIYTLTVTWGDCVVRSLVANISGTLCNLPLPVEITRLQAIAQPDCKVLLSWQVAEESDLLAYEIEHSTDGRTFTRTGTIPAQNVRNKTYAYTDHNAGSIAYYRLKIIERSQAASYSKIVSVRTDCGGNTATLVYPNITAGPVTIEGAPGDAVISIVNSIGSILQTLKSPGGEVIHLDLSAYPAGMYHLHIRSNTETLSHKVIKQ